MTDLNFNQIIDHGRYPIDEYDNLMRQALVERIRQELSQDGCAVVAGFFSTGGLGALLEEAQARVSHTYFSPNKECNVYLGEGAPDLPSDHPRNVFLERNNGFITADRYDQDSVSRRVYQWQPLKRFIADCLGKDELYIYEDPVSNMIVNVGRPGQQFNWHFDTNEFTITMLLQAADSGGYFEYVPNLRQPGDECYPEVQQVIEGRSDRVKRLDLKPGDLQIFLGRFSLHRVTKNTGNRDRLLLIMSFAEQPGMVGNRYRVQDLYGKLAKEHLEDRSETERNDRLLD